MEKNGIEVRRVSVRGYELAGDNVILKPVEKEGCTMVDLSVTEENFCNLMLLRLDFWIVGNVYRFCCQNTEITSVSF